MVLIRVRDYAKSHKSALLEERIKVAVDRIKPNVASFDLHIYSNENQAREKLEEILPASNMVFDHPEYETLALFALDQPMIYGVISNLNEIGRFESSELLDAACAHDVAHLNQLELIRKAPKLYQEYNQIFFRKQRHKKSTVMYPSEVGKFVLNTCLEVCAEEEIINLSYSKEVFASVKDGINDMSQAKYEEEILDFFQLILDCDLLMEKGIYTKTLKNIFWQKAGEFEPKLHKIADDIFKDKLYKNHGKFFRYLYLL